ncbi:hypothetical protein GCM10010233_41060 [Streptomyces pseudogriseolus]|uniref:Uncharacterized protein n=1 Tax=Streptomyces pseudogriseolus TaxID=36817 RepID=A0ABQ2SRW2_STREZ|nr:hypothetical protein GCM10010233_41060 [Streptomyces gancidicus]GGS38367.1 hypothetical protein GCM10010285_16970 [Streptomyces rubiginosus]
MAHDGRGGTPARVPPLLRDPEPSPIGEGGRVTDDSSGVSVPRRAQRWSLPAAVTAARPASRRATGMRNGEQET